MNSESGLDDAEMFASYLRSCVTSEVFYRKNGETSEVFFGDTGLRITSGKGPELLSYCDLAFPKDVRSVTTDLSKKLPEGFFAELESFRTKNTIVMNYFVNLQMDAGEEASPGSG